MESKPRSDLEYVMTGAQRTFAGLSNSRYMPELSVLSVTPKVVALLARPFLRMSA